MPEFELVEAEGVDEDPFALHQCEDCAAGRITGRTFLLSIEEGRAGLSCPVEDCSGLLFDYVDGLTMSDIPVTLAIEKSGGTYEYPNDCDVWFVVTPKEKS